MAELTIEVTPAIIADFRAFYEEFTDSAVWSDTKITKALYIARGEFGGCAHWGDYKPYSFFQRGWFALAAHYNVPVQLSPVAAVACLFLSMLLALVSGLAAIRTLRHADPASLLR